MIASMQPILVGIISLYILNEKISYLQWVGLLLGTLGVIIVVMAKSTVEFTSLNSLLLACISLAGMTIGIIYEKRHKTLCHPLIASCIQCSIALIFTLPFALAFETNKIIWSFSLIGSLFYLVIFNTIISISILLLLIRKNNLTSVNSLFFLVPPFALIIASIVLDEFMPAIAWAGMALSLIGVWVASKHKFLTKSINI